MTENLGPITGAPRIRRLERFAITTPDTDRLVRFWTAAFDCRCLLRTAPHCEQPGVARLALGNAIIDVREFIRPGRPYPAQLSPFDLEFQHFAIVVSDMGQAYARLLAISDWTPISRSGPQHLPESSGGVVAFKFKDPDGHPLELLSFASMRVPPAWQRGVSDRLFQGIDHSALSVSDAPRSIAFYRSLGLQVAARSFNQGIEQELLDGVADPRVDVIALAPAERTPHVELLCYRSAVQRRCIDIQANDVFASQLIFECAGEAPLPGVVVDPDGHRLELCRDDALGGGSGSLQLDR